MATSRARDVGDRSGARNAGWKRKAASINRGGNDKSGGLVNKRMESGGFSQVGKLRNQHGGQRPGSVQHGRQRPGSVQHGRQRPGSVQHGGQRPGSVQAKKKWRHDNLQQKRFEGSAKEGQGFALWRKQKVQLQYKKLLRKHQKTAVPKEDLYAVNYPEHLKHLYLAEEERLKNQESKRKLERERPLITEDQEEELCQTEEQTEEIPQATQQQKAVLPKKKAKKKTSVQKAKEEYERVQQERAKRKKEAEENRKKREDAKELYKKKKMEAFKVLSAKTKKGQPNFNVQMEYLLKKIQGKT